MAPRKNTQEWQPTAFPKPQTFPNAWDGDALMATNGHPMKEDARNFQATTIDDSDWAPEKFPKPRTYPRCWSVDD